VQSTRKISALNEKCTIGMLPKNFIASISRRDLWIVANDQAAIQNSKFKINCSGLLETTVLTRLRADDSRCVVAHGITRAESLHSRSAF
jgi:hypothetical protein